MYNLLMKSSSSFDEWENNQDTPYNVSRIFDGSRVLEYTDDAIREQYTRDGLPDFDEMRKLPCLFTYEGNEVVGRIGWISQVSNQGRQFNITYRLDDNCPRIPMNKERTFHLLGIDTHQYGERTRTHWAVKNVDLFKVGMQVLHDTGNVPVVLTEGEMNRVWKEHYRRKQRVFLSHRAAHQRQVAQIAEYLDGQGLRCFVAHTHIETSRDWQREILNALNTMDVFIGFVTDDFHDGGGWPDQEVGYAWQRRVPRVMVKLSEINPLGMAASEQALHATWENAGEKIIDHLKREGII